MSNRKGTITWIQANGIQDAIETNEGAPGLDELQKWVGGYIELVHVLGPDDKPAHLVVNENSLNEGLPFNEKATEHYHRFSMKKWKRPAPTPIVGNAVLLQGGCMLD